MKWYIVIFDSLDFPDEFNKSMSVLMELRKIAMHPLLVRHRYNNEILREMAREILNDPAHKDADPALVYEDMTVMSDYELHSFCRECEVSVKEQQKLE